MRIGVLSDTHLPAAIRQLDDLGPEPAIFFSSVDLILHSGDLISPLVLDWLEQFAPVLCSTGNNDSFSDHRCEDVQMLDIEGWRIGMVHILGPRTRPMLQLQKTFHSPVEIMISGHSHQEALEYREGVLLLNSGSLTLPQNKSLRLGTVGLLELTPDKVHAEIVALGHTPGKPNPGQDMALYVQDGRVTAPGDAVKEQESGES